MAIFLMIWPMTRGHRGLVHVSRIWHSAKYDNYRFLSCDFEILLSQRWDHVTDFVHIWHSDKMPWKLGACPVKFGSMPNYGNYGHVVTSVIICHSDRWVLTWLNAFSFDMHSRVWHGMVLCVPAVSLWAWTSHAILLTVSNLLTIKLGAYRMCVYDTRATQMCLYATHATRMCLYASRATRMCLYATRATRMCV